MLAHISRIHQEEAGRESVGDFVSPRELHDQLWKHRGVTIVRPDGSEITDNDGPYLLVGHDQLVVTDAQELLEVTHRNQHAVTLMRIKGVSSQIYRERALTDDNGFLLKIQRHYGVRHLHAGRCVLTSEPLLAQRWSHHGTASHVADFWRTLRSSIRVAVSTDGVSGFEGGQSQMAVAHYGFASWREARWAILAHATLPSRNRSNGSHMRIAGVEEAGEDRRTRDGKSSCSRHGGHRCSGADCSHCWSGEYSVGMIRPRRTVPGKRLFDVMFALMAILLTLPFYPLILLAIWLEDGGPLFYGQWREGRGGRQYRCWKFRSMRRDADSVKAKLASRNHADGPQFYIPADPRITRVGRILRRLNIDEWPQFWNVLIGEMSIIGPRPSPRAENRCCPAWRDARLSVLPGITGLWQVMRTRQIGSDFQEWIRYDIEYVSNPGWRMELLILARTMLCLWGRSGRSR